MVDYQRIVVGIPTYRRPRELRCLLESLAPEIAERGVPVVVGDNACDVATRTLVDEQGVRLGLDVHYVGVRDRGISQNRNGIIRAATAVRPDWEWLVCYDDDGVVTPGALGALVAAAESLDADVAGGRVLDPDLDTYQPIVRAYYRSALPDHPTGVVRMINGAQNIALRRRALDRLGDPWFDPRLGLSGSEDHDLFFRIRESGGRLVWVSESVVHEPVAVPRRTVRAALGRAFHENEVNAAVQRRNHGLPAALRSIGKGFYWTGRGLVAGAARGDVDRLAGAVVAAACTVGRGAGLLGVRPNSYGEDVQKRRSSARSMPRSRS